MNNQDIRQAIKDAKLKHYELADLLHISEFTLVRKLRKELSKDEKEKILNIINKVSKEN